MIAYLSQNAKVGNLVFSYANFVPIMFQKIRKCGE